ncbi:hypothetical protein [Nocardiopsis sp. FIRDI 009]|uniref:hypothetical protein n=1 Tax=Nocardiopsis sp. FIRDI 009 TaxID=714197 RepID=UPI0013007213|nr:hypothetical protein [Nocardiopsis sp. FIRDI 009]
MVERTAESGEGLEHVSVHRRSDTDPTIGLFLRSRSLRDAEHTAARIWHRTVETYPELLEYQLFRCEAPLIDDILP